MQIEEEKEEREKIRNLSEEILVINNQIDAQRNRILVSENSLNRFKDLENKGFVSKDQISEKQADYWEQTSKLQALTRDLQAKRRELSQTESDLKSLPQKHQIQVEQLQRALASIEQERSESESRRSLAIVAPEDGVATAVTAEIGQVVDTTRMLAAVVPKHSEFQAQLYAPSNAAGEVKIGDVVLLRFPSFPYQKYGQVRAIITSVSRTTLSSQELNSSGLPTNLGTQPVYLVMAKITENHTAIPASAIQPGMQLEADVLQETRKIYEWILEPLLGLSKRL